MQHEPPGDLSAELLKTPTRSHGIAIRPDQREVWSCDSFRNYVAVHDAVGDEYKQLATVRTDGPVYWLTFTPDSLYCFASQRTLSSVAVIDTQTKQIVHRLEAGNTPKRTQIITVARD